MTLKEFGEEAEIVVQVKISVNDETVFTAGSFHIDGAIDLLGKAERANIISEALENQYEDLAETIEDESRGFNDLY